VLEAMQNYGLKSQSAYWGKGPLVTPRKKKKKKVGGGKQKKLKLWEVPPMGKS